MQLSELELIRREKLTQLRNLGINPYPADLYPVDSTTKDIKEAFTTGKKVYSYLIFLRFASFMFRQELPHQL